MTPEPHLTFLITVYSCYKPREIERTLQGVKFSR